MKGDCTLDCAFYRMDVYAIDASVAYLSAAKLEELLERTYVKLSRALRARAAGEPHPFVDECCYCAPPEATEVLR